MQCGAAMNPSEGLDIQNAYLRDRLVRTERLLRMVAAHLQAPQIGGMSEDQKLAILEWYEGESNDAVRSSP